MNKTGNSRYQFTEEIIDQAVFKLLRIRKYDELTIKEICFEAGINRSSFYAHYDDIVDLMINIENRLSKKMHEIWDFSEVSTDEIFVHFFNFIKEHKYFYKAFIQSNNPSFTANSMLINQKNQFKKILFGNNINYSDTEIEYHLYYFGGGLKGICGLWLQNNCRETPEALAKIIYNEYANNSKYFQNNE